MDRSTILVVLISFISGIDAGILDFTKSIFTRRSDTSCWSRLVGDKDSVKTIGKGLINDVKYIQFNTIGDDSYYKRYTCTEGKGWKKDKKHEYQRDKSGEYYSTTPVRISIQYHNPNKNQGYDKTPNTAFMNQDYDQYSSNTNQGYGQSSYGQGYDQYPYSSNTNQDYGQSYYGQGYDQYPYSSNTNQDYGQSYYGQGYDKYPYSSNTNQDYGQSYYGQGYDKYPYSSNTNQDYGQSYYGQGYDQYTYSSNTNQGYGQRLRTKPLLWPGL
eukprot:864177_1